MLALEFSRHTLFLTPTMRGSTSAVGERVLAVVASVITVFVFVTGITSIRSCSAGSPTVTSPEVRGTVDNSPPQEVPKDNFFLSILKFVAVIVLLVGAIVLTIPAVIIDFSSLALASLSRVHDFFGRRRGTDGSSTGSGRQLAQWL